MNNIQQKVLITGGAGFIGSHTADALSEKGYSIRLFDNLEPPVHNGEWPSYVKKKGYELMRGDVRMKADLEKALKGVSIVYHLAAYQDQMPDFGKFFHTNTVSAALLYEIILEKKLPVIKIVIAGSQFSYGDGIYTCVHDKKTFYPPLRSFVQLEKKEWDILCRHKKPAHFTPFKEDQAVNPTNSYGLSKIAAESLALQLGKTYDIPTVVLRYSIVQGARQSPRNLYSGALRIFVTQALQGSPLTVYEDGNQLRDFVNVHDVVDANLLALIDPKMDFEVWNVGGGRPWKIIDFAKLVLRLAESTSSLEIAGYRRTDTRHAVSDIKKLKKRGWNPYHTPEKSIKEYIEWFKKEGFNKVSKLTK
ncbi:MAG: hypothetical protein A2586_02830 [Candidatus Harrisonbacteria bacterium RIFOXYD1_FULL_40_9]|uniref:NAD-dependent epimerase/dehydratase domain-containing protein n=1 Tax=Candidatus Harrisonbacteria bacterium RIFOXYD1_FULL_40_9 TaxID=1798412 RepID=A0A1G1ZY83_9BACT|nr:MAG: hypothetical protein A2586_02830 [Candidatus Harrisonbacteria bacterium RIFOXYD1_FULL_40_9]